MVDMALNILKAMGEPLAAVLLFVMLAGLVVVLLIGPAILYGVLASKDANLRRRLSGVWWAAYHPDAADVIAVERRSRK